MIFQATPTAPEDATAQNNQGEGNVRTGIKSFNPANSISIQKSILANPQCSAIRQVWIDRLSELGCFYGPDVVEV